MEKVLADPETQARLQRHRERLDLMRMTRDLTVEHLQLFGRPPSDAWLIQKIGLEPR